MGLVYLFSIVGAIALAGIVWSEFELRRIRKIEREEEVIDE